MPAKKSFVSAPVSTVNKPTAFAARIVKNTLAHVDKAMSKMRKNMMSLATKINEPKLTVA